MCVRAYAYVSHDRYWLLLLFSFLFLFLFSFYYFFLPLCCAGDFRGEGAVTGASFWGSAGFQNPKRFTCLTLSLSDLSVISSLCPFLFLSVRFLSLSLISSPLCVNYLLYRTVSFSHSLPVVNFPAVNISDRSAPPPSLLIIHL